MDLQMTGVTFSSYKIHIVYILYNNNVEVVALVMSKGKLSHGYDG